MNGLDRFLAAQEGVYPTALSEIRAGRKASHWMWFIFPQLRMLGRSATARHFGIADLAEARAYLAHPVLGARLHEIMVAILAHSGTPPDEILGPLDARKLRSSATLFEAAGGEGPWSGVLAAFFADERCPRTLEALSVD